MNRLEPDGSVLRGLRAVGMPTSVFIDRDGMVRFVWTGPLSLSEMESGLQETMGGRELRFLRFASLLTGLLGGLGYDTLAEFLSGLLQGHGQDQQSGCFLALFQVLPAP